MKLNKKVIEGAAVLGLVAVLTITAVTNGDTNVAPESTKTAVAADTLEVSTSLENDGLAGASAQLSELQKQETVEEEEVALVSSADEAEEVTTEVVEEEPQLTAEEQEWQNKLMAKVDESLNVRAKADESSDIVGKLYKGARAQIVEQGDTWTLIESGNVKGYVKNQYCVTGTAALEYARKTVDTVAKVTIDGLRIRESASQDAKVVDAVGTGTKLVVNKKADAVDGWVAVTYNSKKGYVSADYVELSLNTTKAITIAEEKAAKEKEEAAKNSGSNSGNSGDSGTSKPDKKQGDGVSADTDQVKLLAALIYCEAGGESYDAQLAVGAVVINRMKSSAYPSKMYNVIYQAGQFSPARTGKLARVLANKSYSSTSVKAAKAAISGQDNTNGAIGFKYYRKGDKGVKIGCIVFFK